MRLSVVFELLLVFLFLAFAAARVIEIKAPTKNVAKSQNKTTTLRQGPPNRYCACTSRMCNCCRDFSLPVVPIKGPGCASIMYVQRDTMSVTMSFGDRVLSNTTITGKTPKPICMALPGGISQFCGRIYGISRKGDQFRACLGLELRALDDIEAALRVSCFKFGPKGVKLESAPPVPVEEGGGKDPEEDDDEDDYDLEDDDDDDDDLIGFEDDEDDGASSEDNEVDSDPVDYTGFSVLGEDFLGTFFSDDSGAESSKKKKVNKKTAKPQISIPKVSTTTRRPILPNIRRSTPKPNRPTVRPLINRVTKKPNSKPQIVQNILESLPASSGSLMTLQTTSPIVPTLNRDKNTPTVIHTTITTTSIPITTQTQKVEKEHLTSVITTEQTELPVTFTLPTEKTGEIKNEIKIPQIDLEKVEAVAAIAQQDVTSGMISSSSLTSSNADKPTKIVTEKYEKILPETNFMSANTEKINPVKFVPINSRPSAEKEKESVLLDEIVNSELTEGTGVTAIKNRITAFYQSTETTVNDDDDDDEGESDNVDETDDKEEEIEESNKVQHPSYNVQGNLSLMSVTNQKIKPHKDNNDEDAVEDILEEVLSDEDNSEIEENEDDGENTQTWIKNKRPAVQNKIKNKDDANNSKETVVINKKTKPIKKKPSTDDNNTEDDDDILSALEGDEDEDDDEDDEDDDDDDESEESDELVKEKHKIKTTTQKTTIKFKIPTTQATHTTNTTKPTIVAQNIKTKNPAAQAIQALTTNAQTAGQTASIQTPATMVEKDETQKVPQKTYTETVTEKVFIYHEPSEKATEKVIIYQEPQVPEKVFIYTESTKEKPQEPTEKVISHEKPVESVTEKIIIYKEPVTVTGAKPVQTISGESNNSTEEDEDSKEESEDEESEEEEDDDNNSEKGTLYASIIKDKPEFSNKYAEEHDLSDGDDLDIEDSENDGSDFEDRKFRQKKPAAKPSADRKPENDSNPAKILSLSDLISKPKKYYDHSKGRPISTSRTHRRMNLDRLLRK